MYRGIKYTSINAIKSPFGRASTKIFKKVLNKYLIATEKSSSGEFVVTSAPSYVSSSLIPDQKVFL